MLLERGAFYLHTSTFSSVRLSKPDSPAPGTKFGVHYVTADRFSDACPEYVENYSRSVAEYALYPLCTLLVTLRGYLHFGRFHCVNGETTILSVRGASGSGKTKSESKAVYIFKPLRRCCALPRYLMSEDSLLSRLEHDTGLFETYSSFSGVQIGSTSAGYRAQILGDKVLGTLSGGHLYSTFPITPCIRYFSP